MSKYLTKQVSLGGEVVTLYSINGITWLSTPDQLPDLMARLENSRITLTDVKSEDGGEKGAAEKERFRPSGARGTPQTAVTDDDDAGSQDTFSRGVASGSNGISRPVSHVASVNKIVQLSSSRGRPPPTKEKAVKTVIPERAKAKAELKKVTKESAKVTKKAGHSTRAAPRNKSVVRPPVKRSRK